MAATLNGGLVLNWVRTLLGASWAELYAAAALPVRPDAPIFLPHLNGERTPYMSTSMRAPGLDLAPHHTRADLLRSALEGVAFSVRDALTALEPDGPAADAACVWPAAAAPRRHGGRCSPTSSAPT